MGVHTSPELLTLLGEDPVVPLLGPRQGAWKPVTLWGERTDFWFFGDGTGSEVDLVWQEGRALPGFQ